jgi:rod shape-determining protein MreC
VPAQVVAIGPAQGFTWTVTIDAGTIDGVTVDMCVINGDGLVGRVVDAGPNTSTVLLIVDATSTVGARMAGSREVGLLNGTGQQEVLELQLLDPNAVLSDGQALVTFGAGGGRPFAPGIPLGEVIDASGTPGQLAQIALVRPYVDISSLDLVGVVVVPPREDPRDSVLPNPPSASPSPTSTPTTAPTDQGTDQPTASPSPTATP